jgi:hypothetical protein
LEAFCGPPAEAWVPNAGQTFFQSDLDYFGKRNAIILDAARKGKIFAREEKGAF